MTAPLHRAILACAAKARLGRVRFLARLVTTAALSFCWALCLAAAPPAIAAKKIADSTLEQSDFAYAKSIELAEPGVLQTLLLDLEVYRGTATPEPKDLRVFDATGLAVPYALRRLGSTARPTARREPLPLFALPPRQGAAEPTDVSHIATGALRIEAEIGQNGAILRLLSAEPTASARADKSSSSYLLDSSQLHQPLIGLDLTLGPESVAFVRTVRLEGSNDLLHFTPISRRSALARLEEKGHRIEQTRIEFPAARYRYLRLAWNGSHAPVEITQAHALVAPDPTPLPRQQSRVVGTPLKGESGSFLFDLAGSPPVDRVEVDLGDANILVEAQLWSASSSEGPWRRRFAGLLYRLDGEMLIQNPAITHPAEPQRYYKLSVSPKGGGLRGRQPVLEASWHPQQLLFIARGKPPFSLAYGRAQAQDVSFAADALSRSSQRSSRDLLRQTARLGPQRVVAGAPALAPPSEPFPMRTLGLWVVLISSVGVVGAMSLRLLREMS